MLILLILIFNKTDLNWAFIYQETYLLL